MGLVVFLLVGLLGLGWVLAQRNSATVGQTSGGTQMAAGGLTGQTDNGRPLPAEYIAKLQQEAVPAQLSPEGVQTLDVAVYGETMSYSPKVIKVQQGKPVTFNLRVEGKDPGCGRFVGIQGLGVHGIATPGEVSQMSFTPNQAGVYQINCGMQMMEPGYLIVAQ